MKNNYIIVSYYTPNYKEIAKKYLLNSLKNFPTLEKHIVEINLNSTNWYNNTNYKPMFILECLKLFDKDLVFTDADSTINSYPYLFEKIPKKYDIGLHYLEWKKQYGNINKKELLSGTLYLRNNIKIKNIVEEWRDNVGYGGRVEQKILEQVLQNNEDIEIFDLPREYCYIETTPKGKPFTIINNPVISHFQASRNLKNK